MKRTLIGTDGEDRLFRLDEPNAVGTVMAQIVTADGTEYPPRTLMSVLAHRPTWTDVESTKLTNEG
jgi:hypothetical protein